MGNRLILSSAVIALGVSTGILMAVERGNSPAPAAPGAATTLASVSGRIVVYDVADIAGGHADRIGEVIRSTIATDAWDKTAAMRVLPGQIEVRYSDTCPANIPAQVAQFIDQLRQTKSLCVRMNYRIVVSDQPAVHADSILIGGDLAPLVQARDFVTDSKIVIQNEESATLVAGDVGIKLPTVEVTPYLSQNRKAITLMVRSPLSKTTRSYTIRDGQTAAIPVNDPAAHQWLVFTATACKLQTIDLSPSPELHGN